MRTLRAEVVLINVYVHEKCGVTSPRICRSVKDPSLPPMVMLTSLLSGMLSTLLYVHLVFQNILFFYLSHLSLNFLSISSIQSLWNLAAAVLHDVADIYVYLEDIISKCFSQHIIFIRPFIHFISTT